MIFLSIHIESGVRSKAVFVFHGHSLPLFKFDLYPTAILILNPGFDLMALHFLIALYSVLFAGSGSGVISYRW
ncbi:hypothetical protein EBS43_03240 [bacterium]|nr:hypothetical protein [bacterium]